MTHPPTIPCARCATPLTPGQGNFYAVRIVAVADPCPPLITEEDLARDVSREIAQLLAQLRGQSEQQLIDQVYQAQLIYLCAPCYTRWIADPVNGTR